MFTGIVQTTSSLVRVEKKRGRALRITLRKPKNWRVAKGASVAVDGICLTATTVKDDLVFDVMEETLVKTTARDFARGRIVNLERPLKVGDELGGHVILGHVDARARVVAVHARATSKDVSVEIPKSLTHLVAPIGSIAINGVSLTVAKKKGKRITVSLIPHTMTHTNLGNLKKGDFVNVEVDVFARYLAAYKER